MLRRFRDYLGEQEPAILVAYAISGTVLLFGTAVMLLVMLGAVDLSFGP